MSDPLTWSMPLGRWAGTQVRVHILFIVFAAFALLGAATRGATAVEATLGWLGLLVLALAIHELAHALTAAKLGMEPEDVRLWPLGNLGGPAPPSFGLRIHETIAVAAAGPVVSGMIALISLIGLYVAGAWMVLNPFGNEQGGTPVLVRDPKEYVALFSPLWWAGWFGFLNGVIFLANLIPAVPLDGGRAFRGMLEGPWSGTGRDGLLAHWTALTCALVVGLVGIFRIWTSESSAGGWGMIGLAVVIFLMARQEARLLDEGGFFDDGVFGYDFSQGYTSLEAGAATVRPRREGALRRWRRRRSELRLQRRLAREAAEDRRMDEILDKLHREGRSALTDEEQRFLVRVSLKYRNRSPRARD